MDVLIFNRPQNVLNLLGVGASFCVWVFIYLYKLRDFSFEELKKLYFFQSDFLDAGLVVCTFVIILVKELIEAFASSWANGVSIKFYNCIDRFWWRFRAK